MIEAVRNLSESMSVFTGVCNKSFLSAVSSYTQFFIFLMMTCGRDYGVPTKENKYYCKIVKVDLWFKFRLYSFSFSNFSS